MKILKRIKHRLIGVDHADSSYAQEGEDLILRRILDPHINKAGFYVDVGAHHPMRFSNTYYFYRLGWRGVNIDAMPGSMDAFTRLRPRDINIEVPISNSGKKLTYYKFNEPALNGFSRELSDARQSESNAYYIEESIELQTRRLYEVLDEFMPKNTGIDFMTVDVEGLDLEVLQSNNWEKYRPRVVLAEILGKSIEDLPADDIYSFLKEQGYMCRAKTVNTGFFLLDDVKL